jgi:hypothetical protein
MYAHYMLCIVVKERSGKLRRPPAKSPELVGLTGLEPVTLRLSSACSNQLSYRPDRTPRRVGGAEETRTPDL